LFRIARGSVSTITKALKAVDNDARVNIDPAQPRVAAEPADATADELQASIMQAGYTPVRMADQGPAGTGAANRRNSRGARSN